LADALGSLPVVPAAAQSTEANNPAGTWLLDDGHYKAPVLPQAGGKWRAKIVALGAGVATKNVANPAKTRRPRNIMGAGLFCNLRPNSEKRSVTNGTRHTSRARQNHSRHGLAGKRQPLVRARPRTTDNPHPDARGQLI
jgi:hypothetical protein